MTWDAKKKRIETRRRAELERQTAPSAPAAPESPSAPAVTPKQPAGKK